MRMLTILIMGLVPITAAMAQDGPSQAVREALRLSNPLTFTTEGITSGTTLSVRTADGTELRFQGPEILSMMEALRAGVERTAIVRYEVLRDEGSAGAWTVELRIGERYVANGEEMDGVERLLVTWDTAGSRRTVREIAVTTEALRRAE